MGNQNRPKIPALIQAEDLANVLSISLDRLYSYCDAFDQNSEDEWELNEGVHFVWKNKSLGIRAFTHEGATEIAKYVEKHVDNKNPFRRLIKAFFNRKQANFIRSLVMERVSDVVTKNGAIQIYEGKAFISTNQTRYILRLHTRQDILQKAVEYEQRGDSGRPPMRPGTHFIDSPDEKHHLYSAEGIKRLSMALQHVCKSRSTQSWNSAVESSIFKTINEAARPLLLEDKELQRAIRTAKSAAQNKCELTNKGRSRTNTDFQLAAHHLYDSKCFPLLRCEPLNIIAIDSQLHQDFHAWMGGTQNSCTGEDFLKWLQNYSEEIFRHCDDPIAQQAISITRLKQRLAILAPSTARMEGPNNRRSR